MVTAFMQSGVASLGSTPAWQSLATSPLPCIMPSHALPQPQPQHPLQSQHLISHQPVMHLSPARHAALGGLPVDTFSSKQSVLPAACTGHSDTQTHPIAMELVHFNHCPAWWPAASPPTSTSTSTSTIASIRIPGRDAEPLQRMLHASNDQMVSATSYGTSKSPSQSSQACAAIAAVFPAALVSPSSESDPPILFTPHRKPLVSCEASTGDPSDPNPSKPASDVSTISKSVPARTRILFTIEELVAEALETIFRRRRFHSWQQQANLPLTESDIIKQIHYNHPDIDMLFGPHWVLEVPLALLQLASADQWQPVGHAICHGASLANASTPISETYPVAVRMPVYGSVPVSPVGSEGSNALELLADAALSTVDDQEEPWNRSGAVSTSLCLSDAGPISPTVEWMTQEQGGIVPWSPSQFHNAVDSNDSNWTGNGLLVTKFHVWGRDAMMPRMMSHMRMQTPITATPLSGTVPGSVEGVVKAALSPR